MEKKEAMKILKDFHDKSALFSVRTALDTVFPEFVESEDERIRKGIIQYLEQSQFGEEHYQIDDDIVRNYIAWLEKQGEQKPTVIIPKFRVGDTIRIKNSNAEYTITEISDGYYRGKGWCLDIAAGDECGDYELVEQKPSEWSEEDETHRDNTITLLEEYKNKGLDCASVCIAWLKSLRPQNTWKPSDKQMELLREVQQALLGKDCHNKFVDFMYELKRLREE